ncbi:hypothetical protein VW23_024345 [Devosia insulae DS-56]|uniref:Uncharacterized protein n=1 Tax=Devosia insulae DS-56 TaxID=1116389 RepID=A0A1E5XME4_9HYPH|nr:hypothetical protein VW23_024345 [Devosia insulae DS-56]
MARTLTEEGGAQKPGRTIHSRFSGRVALARRGSLRENKMTERKTLFRRVFESMIEGRTRQAQRYISQYLHANPTRNEWRP